MLLAAADNPEPPVFEAILALLPEIEVRRWRWLPQPVLLLPDARRWLILVDPDQTPGEQALHALHQVKHVIDAPDRSPGSCEGDPMQTLDCYRFAMGVLVPSASLRHEVASGNRDAEALARRYGVPASAMRQRISELGLMGGGAS